MTDLATPQSATKTTRPPGPRGLPVIGNLFQMQKDRLTFLSNTAQTYGNIAQIRLGKRTINVLTKPEYIYQVLVSQGDKFHKFAGLREAGSGLLGDGLLTADGEFHKKQRKIIQPAFHTTRVLGYAQTMTDYTLAHLKSWHDGQTVDMHGEMMALTRDIIAKLLFNADVSAEGNKIGDAVTDLLEGTDRRLGIARVLPKWLQSVSNDEKEAAALVTRLIDNIIEERRKSAEDTGDVLSMLLAAMDDGGGGMDDRQVFEEAMTLFLAGHETTANTTAWTWYLLSQNPDAAKKLHDELDRALGDRPPTAQDLAQLPYLDGVIKESMRMYPAAWTVGIREALTDVEIGGYYFGKGALFMMPIWVMHHDPTYFPDAYTFKPERWANDYQKQLPRYVYYPFGAGNRVCIGQPLAEMEARLIVAAIAQHWNVTLVPSQDIKPIPMITLRPNTLKMTLHAR